jgi:voltage-gated potassium channel
MYMVEGEAQPRVFSSIPAAMWWAIVTLTTVGYGDMVPVTPPGRVLGGFVSVIGIGTLALFSGILTASFMDQLRIRREKLRQIVEADAAVHQPMDDSEVEKLERIGEQLGLPDEDVEEIVDAVLDGRSRTHCPHCGQPLDVTPSRSEDKVS